MEEQANLNLAEKKCLACHGEIPVLTSSEQNHLLTKLDAWSIEGNGHLSKVFKLKDFQCALDLANQIGAIAQAEGHHPDLLVRWGELIVTIWTHKVNGLTESDFILAAKVDKLKLDPLRI